MSNIDVLTRRFERERRARQEAEAHLEQKSRELFLKNQELEAAIVDLKAAQAHLIQNEKLASIGQLAAGVAHEINNPIGFINSNLASLRDYIDDLKQVLDAHQSLVTVCDTASDHPTVIADIRKVERAVDLDYVIDDLDSLIADSLDGADRVRQIVGDLRDFSHVDAPELSDVDLNELIEKTISVAKNEIKHRAELTLDLVELPIIVGNGGKLGQLVLNILVNAAQAIESDGTIQIRTGHDEKSVWFSIADSGCGIPEDVVSRIFDPFFTTKDVGSGTGLGLHMCSEIVELHAGDIAVESVVGEGSTFTVRLPIVQETQHAA